MKVKEAMTRAPLAIDERASLQAALRMMEEHSIRHLPVVDRGRLVGIISSRDLLGRTGWRELASGAGGDETVPHFRGDLRRGGDTKRVGDIMTRDAITVSPGDDVVTAAGAMIERSVGCLPVIENGHLLGMLSELDLLDLVSAEGGFSLALGAPIGSLLREPAGTLASWSTLDQVDECMQTRGVRHVPVVDGGRLVGMVSDHDMRRAAGRGVDWDTAVHSLMSEPVVTVNRDGPVSKAAASMSDRRIGCVVVTDKDGEVYVVTTREILQYVMGAL